MICTILHTNYFAIKELSENGSIKFKFSNLSLNLKPLISTEFFWHFTNLYMKKKFLMPFLNSSGLQNLWFPLNFFSNDGFRKTKLYIFTKLFWSFARMIPKDFLILLMSQLFKICNIGWTFLNNKRSVIYFWRTFCEPLSMVSKEYFLHFRYRKLFFFK